MNSRTPFARRYPVRFEDCDPAGIVFYPRYFLMANRIVEDWFGEALGVDFATLHGERRIGTSTVDIKATFPNPSRLGETLDVSLEVRRLGGKSFTLGITATADSQVRFTQESVVVCTELVDDGVRGRELPDDLRRAMQPFVAGN